MTKYGKSDLIEIDLTGIAVVMVTNGFYKNLRGINPYQVGEIIGSEYKLLDTIEKLTIKISNDITSHLILEDDSNLKNYLLNILPLTFLFKGFTPTQTKIKSIWIKSNRLKNKKLIKIVI